MVIESISAGGNEADDIRRKALEYAASRRAPRFRNDPSGHSLTPEEQKLVDNAVERGATASELDRLVKTRRDTSLPSDQRTELDRFAGGPSSSPKAVSSTAKSRPSSTPKPSSTPPSAGQVRQAQQTANFNKQVKDVVTNVGNTLGAKPAAQSIDDKIAAYKGTSNQSNATADPFDPVKLAATFRNVVGVDTQSQSFRVTSGRQFHGPVSDVDVMQAANAAGHDPSSQENLYDVKEAYNSPINQRMLAQQQHDMQDARIAEARATGQVSSGNYEERVGALKTAGAPYMEGGQVFNPPAGTEGKDFNTNTGEWVSRTGRVSSAAEDKIARDAHIASGVETNRQDRLTAIREGRVGGSFSGPEETQARIDYLRGSSAPADLAAADRLSKTLQSPSIAEARGVIPAGNSAPTTDQMRASLASAREVQNQVASRESQNTNPTQVQPNQPPPPLQNKRPEDNY